MRKFQTQLALTSATLLAAAALSTAAQAAVVDTFDTEPAGTPQNILTNWNVTGGVDVVDNNTFSIFCLGNAGRCIDLDGSPGPGELSSKTAVAFDAGEIVTLAFYASGNQRTGGSDNLYAGFTFDGSHTFTRTSGGAFGAFTSGSVTKSGFQQQTSVSGDAFQLFTISFVSDSAGSAHAFIGTTSGDNVGPVLDNVSFGVAVPEPATWAMMLLGFGGMGAVLRRRRAVYA